MLRVIPQGLALLYRYYPLVWRILWLTFCYCYCSYFYLYIAMEECDFLSIVISFVRNISLLTLARIEMINLGCQKGLFIIEKWWKIPFSVGNEAKIVYKVISVQSKDFVAIPQSRKVIIIKSYVAYPSFRLLRRSFD